jgi:hypothetical protein
VEVCPDKMLGSKLVTPQGYWLDGRHIDADLKHYRCMMESCVDSHPSFASFDEWSQHMNGHSRLWYQRIFLTQRWGCAVCDFDGIYADIGALFPT